MNNLIKSILLMACLGMITACSGKAQTKTSGKKVVNNPKFGKWQKASKPPITFTKTLTIGNQKDLLLSGRILGPVVDSAGNIYFIDAEKAEMYSFSPDGTLRWKKGQKGKGPGDFKRPFGLVIHGNRLYVSNIRGTRIDKFNLQGNLVNSTPSGHLFVSVDGIVSDSLLVTSSGLMGTLGTKVTILNIKII